MADASYVSRVRVEPVEGRIRRAHILAEEPVLFGGNDDLVFVREKVSL
jgi:hypothetical protein